MFEIIETNSLNTGFSLDLPADILHIFDELTAYCDLQGYPQELKINLHNQGGLKHIRPTKQNLNGISYRLAVNGMLDKLPATADAANLLQEKYSDAELFHSDLERELQCLTLQIKESSDKIATREKTVFDAVHNGDATLADKAEDSIAQIKKETRRAEIMLESGKAQLSKMQPLLWCLSLLKDRADLKCKREKFKAIESEFDVKLLDFAEAFKTYLETAKEAGLETRIFGDKLATELTNPFSKMAMRKKILTAVDLVE